MTAKMRANVEFLGIEGAPNPIEITTCRNFGRNSRDRIISNDISKYDEFESYDKGNDM